MFSYKHIKGSIKQIGYQIIWTHVWEKRGNAEQGTSNFTKKTDRKWYKILYESSNQAILENRKRSKTIRRKQNQCLLEKYWPQSLKNINRYVEKLAINCQIISKSNIRQIKDFNFQGARGRQKQHHWALSALRASFRWF